MRCKCTILLVHSHLSTVQRPKNSSSHLLHEFQHNVCDSYFSVFSLLDPNGLCYDLLKCRCNYFEYVLCTALALVDCASGEVGTYLSKCGGQTCVTGNG
jgi:hypothetical protein